MSTAEVLRQWGISRAPEVVAIAERSGLELAVAAAKLARESYGGLNVWGHDPVNTGGVYIMGAPVTREAYQRYQELGLPSQGVGPSQLTSEFLQVEADRRGGAWVWEINLAVGMEHMASLIRRYGLGDGMRAYNGSGPAAERYRTEMLQAVALWRARLGEGNTTTSSAPPVTSDEVDVNLDDQLPDFYAPGLKPMTVGATISWAAAHSAHARDEAIKAQTIAAQALAGVQDIKATVEGLAKLVAGISIPAPRAAAEPLHYPSLAKALLAELGSLPDTEGSTP